MGLISRICFILAALCLVIASGCGSQPTRDNEISAGLDSTDLDAYARKLLAEADKTEDKQKKIELMLLAAEPLAQSGDSAWARAILSNLPLLDEQIGLSSNTQVRLALVKSFIASSEGDSSMALAELSDDLFVDALAQADLDLQINAMEHRASLMSDQAMYHQAVEQRLELSTLLMEDQAAQVNNEKLWQNLMELPLSELRAFSQTGARLKRGWYELATLCKDNQTNLVQQVASLDFWALNWPDHPASLNVPADLQLLKELVANQPKKIAVLLPFSGKLKTAGDAIRDGIMAAYYQLKLSGNLLPIVQFYDANSGDINQLYDQAVSEGAELILGPLEKSNIEALSLRPDLPIPTLVLNAIDMPLGPVSNLYQFGLGVEDEARQAAHRAWRDGKRRSLVITPNNLWGDRSANTYIQTWTDLGGEIVDRVQFNEGDYSKIVAKALNVEDSKARARALQRIVGHVEFTVRRRQDLDNIFLAANPKEARQIKPTLAFYFAGDLPVYATRQVYSGQTQQKLDQDLNGIKFSTLPWILDQEQAQKQEINQYADDSPNLQGLYALGVDAFFVYPRLRQLESFTKASYYGNTGKLSLSTNRQIEREQSWAEFDQGRVRALSELR